MTALPKNDEHSTIGSAWLKSAIEREIITSSPSQPLFNINRWREYLNEIRMLTTATFHCLR